MGCAAAYAAAQAGHKVRLFERHGLGNKFGSSHGPSRIIRLSYGDDRYIPLSRRAYIQWRALEAEAGETLLTITGGIDVARPMTQSLERTCDAMNQAGVAFEQWTGDEIRRAYPQFRFSDDFVAAYQADTGVLSANRCVEAYARLARRAGAVISEAEHVISVTPDGAGVKVETSRQMVRADRAILCAGAGMSDFLGRLRVNLPLVVTKEQASYLAVRRPEDFAPGRFPVCIRHFDEPIFCSIFPILGAPGVKMMIEQKTPSHGDFDYSVDPEHEDRVRREAGALIDGVTGEILWTDTCRYTLTQDEHFLVDRHPVHPQIILCSACSGHGFKFAPVIGDMLVALAAGDPLPPACALFGVNRGGLQMKRPS